MGEEEVQEGAYDMIYDSLYSFSCAKTSEMDGEAACGFGSLCTMGFFRLFLVFVFFFFINKNAYFVFSFEFISLQLMQNLLKSVSLGFLFFFF